MAREDYTGQSPEQLLADGIARLGLQPPPGVADALLVFSALLIKWNSVYNLTAITDPADIVRRHLLDSLAVLPHVRGARVIDVGTGAGLPGIPLALMLPGWQFVLLDANAKKTRFVRQAAAELSLANVEVVHSRVEKYRPVAGFDSVLTRAYAGIPDMLAQAQHLANATGRILAMKGEYPETELENLPGGLLIEAIHELTVPGLQAQRHVIIMVPKAV